MPGPLCRTSTGFLKTSLALLAVLCLAANSSSVDKYSPYCKLDKTTRDLIWNLLPLSVRLGGKVYLSFTNVSSKWLTPADQWGTTDFSLSIAPRPLNSTELTPPSLLLADQRILSSFLPLIKNSSVEFERFPDGSAVAQHLRKLGHKLRFMISILRRLQRIFNFGTKTATNTSAISVSSGSQLTAALPMRTSQVTSHNFTRASNSTIPTIHGVALRVSLILDDLYSSLLQMDVDFNKIRKIKCSV